MLCPVAHPDPEQFRNDKIIYRRYAGLFFCVCVDSNDNELAYLEAIHLFVEVLGTPSIAYSSHGLADPSIQMRSSKMSAS